MHRVISKYAVSTLQDREPGQLLYSLSTLCDLMQSVAMEVMQGRNVQEEPCGRDDNVVSKNDTKENCQTLLVAYPVNSCDQNWGDCY